MTTTHAVSSIRLAVAIKAMSDAHTISAVIAAKDKAKRFGLTKKDMALLEQAFKHNLHHVRNHQELNNEYSE